jgi:hypothetical protein
MASVCEYGHFVRLYQYNAGEDVRLRIVVEEQVNGVASNTYRALKVLVIARYAEPSTQYSNVKLHLPTGRLVNVSNS